ncbi:unannotated protein [freshwater metagenome]|uniref:Unannotated protein n=1 Tax=freshwater metagenome TaxID=449393 RepID=A0A6J7QJY9_9ZZZZ
MLAGWGHVGVEERLDAAVEIRAVGVPAVLALVERALEVLDRGSNADEAAVLVGAIAESGVERRAVEGEVHLRGRALESVALDGLDQVARKLARVDEFEEGASRVERADHHGGEELGAVFEGHAGDTAVVGDDVLHGRLEPNLGSERLGRTRECVRHTAVAALVERPVARAAVVLAEREQQEDQARALRHRAHLGSDNSRRRHMSLERHVLEVVVEEVGDAAGEQPHGVVHNLLIAGAEVL